MDNRGGGGTGRALVPVTETRPFDGNGYAELWVPDIVPLLALSVSAFGTPLSDVVLKVVTDGPRANALVRQCANGGWAGGGLGWPGVFPIGLQNITVAATWGMAVTADIWEAIRCEAAARLWCRASCRCPGWATSSKRKRPRWMPTLIWEA